MTVWAHYGVVEWEPTTALAPMRQGSRTAEVFITGYRALIRIDGREAVVDSELPRDLNAHLAEVAARTYEARS